MNKPNLYIMVGLPGSGKDTVAKSVQHQLNIDKIPCIILSSDDIRVELFGYEDQTNNSLVFEEMSKRCKEALKNGTNVIYNATNLNRKKRKGLINEMKKFANISSILCLAPIGTLFERNLMRPERHIPEDKLLQMIRTIDVPLQYEGYETIYFINTDNLSNSEDMAEWFKTIGENYDQQNEHHNETLLGHLKTTMDKVKELAPDDETLQIAARLHDIGKPYVKEWNEKKQKYTYYDHHRVSAYLYLLWQTYLFDIRYSPSEIEKFNLDITSLIYHHMDKFIANLDKTKELLGEELYSKLEILMEADAFRKE